jgi:hypothetical protein
MGDIGMIGQEGMISLMNAIRAINPSAECTVPLDVDKIIWHNDTSPIAKEDILAKQAELQADYDALDYARKRKAAYPDIYDYMDGIVKNDQTQIDKYIADSQAVKARYKKG